MEKAETREGRGKGNMNRQQAKIIQYMRDHGSITPLEAIYHCGCTKLSTRLSELSDCIAFDKEMVTVKDRDGVDCRVMRYRTGNGENQLPLAI